MHSILLLGAGKIGRMIAKLLVDCGDYDVVVGDRDPSALEQVARQSGVETRVLDAGSSGELAAAMQGRTSVISALSYRFNPLVAQVALERGLDYFDLTEDLETSRRVRETASKARLGQIFMPQCGLAPGFVSIAAHHLTRSFDSVDAVHMRVGALPQYPSNALKYNLTWSTDGLINEYCNSCQAIHDGQTIAMLPLEGLEHFSLNGIHYEAFNTSGGAGTLCESLEGKVRELNYKTVRYVGHRELMVFLLQGLRLRDRREVLRDILEKAIPITLQDVVVIFCNVAGWQQDQFVQLSDARQIYPKTIDGQVWSAIQVTTAAAICAVVDLHFEGKVAGTGFVRQEEVDFQAFLDNRFGRHYRSTPACDASCQSTIAQRT